MGETGVRTELEWWYCPDCGCTDVEIVGWIHANTGEVCSKANAPHECAHCPQCADLYGDVDKKLEQRKTMQLFKGEISQEKYDSLCESYAEGADKC